MKKALLILLFLGNYTASAQVTTEIPSPQIKCDINNTGDMIEVFNLRDSEAEIITGQTNVVVTYHETSGDALGNGGVIPNPEAYENLPPEQLLFVRVENVANSSDWQVTTMEIIVRQSPAPLTFDPAPLVEDETTGDGDGIAIFNLTEIDAQLFSDPFAQEITYYLTQTDAESASNPIADPENYVNSINPQTIYARAQSAPENECSVIVPFQVIADQTLEISVKTGDSFSLYPNPANSFLFLRADTTFETAVIFSASGQHIKTTKQVSNIEMNIAINFLKKGIYFLQIDNNTVHTFLKK